MDNAKEIATLNSLIEISRDGEEGFRIASEGVTDIHIKEVFGQYSEQRAKFVRDLQQQVQKIGGTPETSGSLSGTLHRGWINIKSIVTGGDERKIVAEAERGEDVAKAAFERAILEPLPPTTLAIVRHMLAQVREAHDRVRAMEKGRRAVSMHDDRALEALRRWSVVLDSAFRVPGTRITFGLDPILGLVPGLGDLTTPLFAILLLLHAVRLRIPRVVQLRMLLNAALDFVAGLVPVIGDLVDLGWKANVRNLALLERHARPGSAASAGDWAFVLGVIGVLLALALIPLLTVAWVAAYLARST